ncbi:phytoene/squalene synthase family protein [Staphylococcus chromogenes]|uniref:4,4'-diapophytoene synthase n=4 Tax=Staphylococcus TaxID=1279 RepID=A0AAE5SY83_STACR|nr:MULTISPECIES: phytoene/squalene synthase family protein [Staphylococcus]KDP12203.1 squalene desaturase [Staphylococcus chromogenes MU 970]MBV5138545.1 phytoene/squalene synthase family protein [Staphylococcus chromogenes]MBV5191451.1 phytoene/squalene synthase family protein [Staphylococcus chromogenes]MBW3133074.1 phytoene/squalene synthase family protein [Staphylococcus chromogenes]MBW6089501.1 phytoene/squalene synthase family protein [Staphylococcus chromogenes]
MNQLERDYNHCHNIMKEHSKTFSYAFDFLDLKRKKAIWAIYAVCRIIDDSIDKYKDLEQLDGIARDLDVIYSDCDYIQAYQSDAAIMNALSNTLNTYSIPKKPFESLIQYVKEDLVLKEMQTDSDLYEYCYGVAGTVGELLTPILASSNKNSFEQAKEAAIALGKALQITNILRDVGEDFQNGRIYLSAEKLVEYQVDLQSVYHEGITSNYIQLWESYALKAVSLYDIALNGINYFDTEVRYIIELAATAYLEILEEVRKSNYSLHKKVYVSKLKKMKIYREISEKYNRSEPL